MHTGCQSGALSSKLLMGQPAPRTRLPYTPALLGRNSGPALLRLAPSARGPTGHSQTDRLPVRTEASSAAAGPGVSAAWRLFSKPAWQNLGTGHSGFSGQGPGGQAPPPRPGGWQTLLDAAVPLTWCPAPALAREHSPRISSSCEAGSSMGPGSREGGLTAGTQTRSAHRRTAHHRPGLLASKGRSGL